MSSLIEDIRDAIRSVVGGSNEQLILLHEPYLPESAWTYVKECIDTGWVSSAGAYVTKFEEKVAEITSSRYAVATVNGTSALEMCFRLAGVESKDEVICPSLTFVATANAISHCDAIPHFVDVEEKSFSLCPAALSKRLSDIIVMKDGVPNNRETNRKIGAVCLMHCFGHSGDIDPILELCEQYGIPLIEDAAESLGTYYKGVHTGRFGKLAAFSFNGNKLVTTGGGGAIVTDDEDLAKRAKHLTTTAKTVHPWEFHHDEIAWNYRLPNINAALGFAQLEFLPELLKAKKELATQYQHAFVNMPGVSFMEPPKHSNSNNWLNCLLLDLDHADERDDVLATLNGERLQCRPVWQPMHHLPMYAGCPRGELNATESLTRRAINIPSSATIVLNKDG